LNEGSTYHYSAEDIQKYLQGKMNAAEMHALEKTALDDPFLAEAIEGYRDNVVNLSSDMDILRSRLQERTEVKKEKRGLGWLTMVSAAALVLSLSFAAWLFFQPKEQQPIAKTETKEARDSAPEPPEPQPLADTPVATRTEQLKEATTERKKLAEPPIEPVKEVNVQNEEQRTPDLAATKPPAASQPPAAAQAPETSRADVARDEATTPENKVAPRAARVRSMLAEERGAQPTVGWAEFQNYLSKNLRAPAGQAIARKGSVTISFLVNGENGKPYDFKVERSLHPDYDAEAIRVLKDGPTWTPVPGDKNTRTTQIIVF
jgi:hypothetical protein